MKKIYNISGLCCPSCSSKIEQAVGGLNGVRSCSLSFLTGKMLVDVKDEISAQTLFSDIKKEVHKIEMDAEVAEQ